MNNEQLLKRIEELENWKKNMEASHSIPLNIDQAFRGRFLNNSGIITDAGDGGAVSVSVYNSFDVNVPVVSGKRTLIIDGVEYDFLYQ